MTETLRAEKWPILELVISAELSGTEQAEFTQLANEHQLTLQVEPPTRLTQLCGAADHQGYLAKMPPFPYDAADDLLAQAVTNPLYLLLDSIQDPFNFGAILRTAEVLGVNGVFVGATHQSKVNSQVARSSAGAVNTLPLVEVADLVDFALQMKSRDIKLVAATEKSSKRLYDFDFNQPVMLIIGNEGAGIRQELLNECDQTVAIPQAGTIGSLNAAVAASILMYEVYRQRLCDDAL